MKADEITWEVVYDDDTTLTEAGGGKYADIARSKGIKEFRLVHPDDGLIWSKSVTANNTDFVYRRRTMMSAANREVKFLVGWEPWDFYLVDEDGNEEELNLKDPDLQSFHDYEVRTGEGEKTKAKEDRKKLKKDDKKP